VGTVLKWSHHIFLIFGFGSLACYGLAMLDVSSFEYYTYSPGKPAPTYIKEAPPGQGAVVGTIDIPAIGLSTPILEGVSSRALRLAVGRIPGTALPGDRGNMALAGHRDTVFRGLSRIKHHDQVVVTTPKGSQIYRVRSMEVVEPKDTRVLEPTSESKLTLVTCYPFRYIGPAPKRFIVHAYRDEGS